MSKILWIDVETTGLDAESDILLEVGLRITNVDGDNLDEITSLVWTPNWRAHLVKNEAAFEMHQKSGLVEALNDFERSRPPAGLEAGRVGSVDFLLAEWVEARLGKEKYPMAGNTTHLDRSFVARYMPKLLERFHYRNFDVSSTREQLRVLNPELFAKLEVPKKAHRPQGDIDNSVHLWKWLIENFLFDARAFG